MEGRSVIFKKIDQISKYVKAHESSLSLWRGKLQI